MRRQDPPIYSVPDNLSGKEAFQNKYIFEESPDNDRYLEKPMEHDSENAFTHLPNQPVWQFHFRLNPEKKNLQKAAAALSDALADDNVHFKLINLAGDTPSKGYDPVQDYTAEYAKTPNLDIERALRNRVGLEFCVQMKQSSIDDQFQYSPDGYKVLMLKCIKALQDNGVSFGSIIAPIGTMNINCGKDIPPFISYGYFAPSPYQENEGRHGVLPKSEFRPEGKHDPLKYIIEGQDGIEQFEGIEIREQDLIEAGIDIVALQTEGKRRIRKQQQHYQTATESIQRELKDIWDLGQDKRYSTIFPEPADVPLNPTKRHSPYLNQDYLSKIEHNVALQTDYYYFLESEKQDTENDFKHNAFAMDFLTRHLFKNPAFQAQMNADHDINLKNLVKRDLKRMQILYLRLRHLEHEQACLKNALLRDNVNNIMQTAYERLRTWQPQNFTLFDNFRKLLEDLTPAAINPALNPNSPVDEEKFNTALDIARFVNNALPTELKFTDTLMEVKQPEDIPEKTRKTMLRSELKTLAQKLAGKGPTWGKVLGAVLFIGGLILGTLCVLSLIPSLGLSSIPGFTVAPWMMATGAGIFGATAIVGAGAYLYCRDTGPCKTAQTIAAAV